MMMKVVDRTLRKKSCSKMSRVVGKNVEVELVVDEGELMSKLTVALVPLHGSQSVAITQ